MSDNNFTSVMDSLLKGIDSVISTKTVVGEAKQIGDTIILPLVIAGISYANFLCAQSLLIFMYLFQ